MHTLRSKSHYIDIIFILSLFFLFTFSSCALIVMGANHYGKTADKMNQHFDTQTVPAYLIEKIHQNDIAGSVFIDSVSSHSVLELSQEINGISYTTYLYAYEGYLCELFTRSDLDFSFEYGKKILPISDVSFSWYTKQLLEIKVDSQNNKTETVYVSLITNQKQGGSF